MFHSYIHMISIENGNVDDLILVARDTDGIEWWDGYLEEDVGREIIKI